MNACSIASEWNYQFYIKNRRMKPSFYHHAYSASNEEAGKMIIIQSLHNLLVLENVNSWRGNDSLKSPSLKQNNFLIWKCYVTS